MLSHPAHLLALGFGSGLSPKAPGTMGSLWGWLAWLVLAPLFPMRVDIPDGAFLLLPVVAIAIGLIASGAGLRRAVSVDPALAFGGP